MNVRVALPALLVLGIITGAIVVYAAIPTLGLAATSTQTETQLAIRTLHDTITQTSTVPTNQKTTLTTTTTTTAFSDYTLTSTVYFTETVVSSKITTRTATSTSTVTSTLQTDTTTETATQTVTVTRTDLVPGPDLMTFSGSGNATSPPFTADHHNLHVEMSVNASDPSKGAAISWYMYAVNGSALVGQGSVNTLGDSSSWAFGLNIGDAYYVKVVPTNAIWSVTVSGKS